jgi:hypothetical protein
MWNDSGLGARGSGLGTRLRPERPFDRLSVVPSQVEGRARAGVGPREH